MSWPRHLWRFLRCRNHPNWRLHRRLRSLMIISTTRKLGIVLEASNVPKVYRISVIFKAIFASNRSDIQGGPLHYVLLIWVVVISWKGVQMFGVLPRLIKVFLWKTSGVSHLNRAEISTKIVSRRQRNSPSFISKGVIASNGHIYIQIEHIWSQNIVCVTHSSLVTHQTLFKIFENWSLMICVSSQVSLLLSRVQIADHSLLLMFSNIVHWQLLGIEKASFWSVCRRRNRSKFAMRCQAASNGCFRNWVIPRLICRS